MRNVFRVFLQDWGRIIRTPATWTVLCFLLILPSLYAWLNIYAFWNPYGNTSAMEVCVVNEDEGTESPRLGKLALGQDVVDELHCNDQLHWTFVDYDTAMDRVDSGKAYAAFVIPAEFSADVASIVTDDFHSPKLEYYVNEKAGPISPKITDTGANELDATINDTFFSTVSSKIADRLDAQMDQTEQNAEDAKESAAGKIHEAAESVEEARNALSGLADGSQGALDKAADAQGRLGEARTQLDGLSQAMDEAAGLLGDTNTALISVSGQLNSALDDVSADLSGIAGDLNQATSGMGAAINQALQALKAIAPPTGDWQATIESLEAQLAAAENATNAMDELVANSLDRCDEYRRQLSTETVPGLSQGLSGLSSSASSLAAAIAGQKMVVDQVSAVLSELEQTLTLNGTALESTETLLADVASDLSNLETDIGALQTSGTLERIFGEDGVDARTIEEFMLSPTRIETSELYPLNSFGSAMAPLFINLTLWIGVFMLMVVMRLEVSGKGIRHLTISQRYLGRFLTLCPLSVGQALICCAGCALLGVQIESLPLFVLTTVVAALAYLAVQYALSVTFQHVGKALCVILVFVQIPGASGLYPLELIPDFFQAVYPLFPFTYSINALRETICGFYDGVWVHCLIMLGMFFALFTLIGLVVRPYLTNLNRLFTREIRESGIINGEAVELPARRYRLTQVLSSLANQSAYRTSVNRRVLRFMDRYPRYKQAVLIGGLVALVALTVILALCHCEKVIILTVWLGLFILIMGLFIALEYFRDYLGHLVSLDGLSVSKAQELLSNRDDLTAVRPLVKALGVDRPDKPDKPDKPAKPEGSDERRPR